VKYDLRSSGIASFEYDLTMRGVDLGVNFARGNPAILELLARRYHVQRDNVFVSSEGASGQNTRIIRCLARLHKKRNEAIVEHPTYEPLLRKTQDSFHRVRRLKREEEDDYKIDLDRLRELITERTALLVLTNPHAPTGQVSSRRELKDLASIASEHGFHVLCDEIYSEFNREAVPNIFSLNPDQCIVTTSFTKAYGLGGLKLGIALANKDLVDELCNDTLNTVGTNSNIVQLIAVDLLTKQKENLEKHKLKWVACKKTMEKWLKSRSLKHSPDPLGVTYWVTLPIEDTYKWTIRHTIPQHSVASVPGAFFLFKDHYGLEKSNKIRLGLGNIDPDEPKVIEALEALENSLNIN
jgi:hypothetical protein